MKIRGKIEIVDVKKVKPNKWNPNVQSDFLFFKTKTSIKDHDFIDPVTVRMISKGKYEIIDGEHRWKAAIEEGANKIEVKNLGKVSDEEAQALTILMNELKGKSDENKLSLAMKQLESSMGFEKLKEMMPFDPLHLETMIKSTEVDWDNIGPDLNTAGTTTGGLPPLNKTISLYVPTELYSSFFKQIDRINKILFPNQDVKECDPVMAVQSIIDVLSQTDLESLLSKALKPAAMLKKRAEK
jgi:hypothetical protein